MFKPQATPYANFATYGPPHGLPEYSFQQPELALQTSAAALAVGGSVGGTAGGGVTCGEGDPLIFTTPAFNPVVGSALSSYNTTGHSATPPLKMEPNAEDLARQEAAAREYQPQLKGPLVGEKISSHVITDEYAKADQVYVDKTIALPQTYSHYRPIQGDGNCGWRAIGFSYFETLINRGTRAIVDAETERLNQLSQYILTVGQYDPFLYEDMVDETLSLLQDISACKGNRDAAMAHVMEKFNSDHSSNAIIYHLRLLAASYLKGHSDLYAGFIPGDLGPTGYCLESIEPPQREIDHLGIMLLVNILLKPIGFVLEIAMLDRTPGTQANIYRFPEDAVGRDEADLGPMIYLLYRPDHYDILYKEPPASRVNVQVNRATSISHRHEINSNMPSLHTFATLDMTALSMLPGFGPQSSGISPLAVPADSPVTPAYTPSPQSPWLPSPYVESLPIHPAPSIPASLPPPTTANGPMRFSPFCHPSFTDSSAFREPTFKTSTFKNSHFNTAHYNNPNFQPEEYKPDAEEETPRDRGGGRKRSSG